MANGTVKWFNTTKGYGFIAPEGGNKDVFVHISAVERSGLTGLADDQKVTFDIEPYNYNIRICNIYMMVYLV